MKLYRNGIGKKTNSKIKLGKLQPELRLRYNRESNLRMQKEGEFCSIGGKDR